MNKKGLGFNLLLALVCGLLMFILVGLPVLYPIINQSLGGMGEVVGFIVKLFIFFIFMLFMIMIFNTVKNRGGLFQ
jgi:hypothetical protein